MKYWLNSLLITFAILAFPAARFSGAVEVASAKEQTGTTAAGAGTAFPEYSAPLPSTVDLLLEPQSPPETFSTAIAIVFILLAAVCWSAPFICMMGIAVLQTPARRKPSQGCGIVNAGAIEPRSSPIVPPSTTNSAN